MIHFKLSEHPADKLAFAYSPGVETLLSLHVIANPKHHPIQHRLARRARNLPEGLRRMIRRYAYAYGRFIPDVFLLLPTGDFPTFGEEMARLWEMPAEQVLYELTVAVHCRDVGSGSELCTEKGRALMAERSKQLDPQVADDLMVGVEDPEQMRCDFIQLLTDYWERMFGSEWHSIEEQLTDAVARAGRSIAHDGFLAFLKSCDPQFQIDVERATFSFPSKHDHEVFLTEEDHLVVVPSMHAWPHVPINCDAPAPYTIIYPPPTLLQQTSSAPPPGTLLTMLKALANDTRLRALKEIASQPRSTQELAPLLHVSEAGLSKHLTQMAATGLLNTRREGYFVLYELNKERIDQLSEALGEFLS